MKVEIDILNYNGAYLMQDCLPSIALAAKRSSHECRLVIVDNLSTDNSAELVKSRFPEFTFYSAKKNDVLCSFNEVAESSDADVMIFLNNDLRVDENFIDPLIDIFMRKDKVFMVTGKTYNFKGSEVEGGVTKPLVEWGLVKGVFKYKGYENDLNRISYTLASGSGAFDRKKFLEIGGYDRYYLPGIVEDTDVCFRAWLRGYDSYYHPGSIIYHMGKTSFRKRFGNRRLLAISHRNTYFFIWKNITDVNILFQNILFALPRMVYAALTRKWDIIWGYAWFVSRLPDVIKRRREEALNRKYNVRTDKEVFRILR